MRTHMARRLGIFGMAVMVALTVGGSSVAAQAPVGQILSTNSPEYRQAIGQASAQAAFNQFGQFGYGYNQFYNGQQFGYFGGGVPYYGGQQFVYNQFGGTPYYGGQQFTYAPFYGGQQFGYNNNFYGNNFGYGVAVPDAFFPAVGCEVGNYTCYFNKTR